VAYATTSDVQARFAAWTIGSGTSVTTTQVTQWLVEADAFINRALTAAGLTAPATNADLLQVFKSAATDYALGYLRMALAAAGGDGSNDDGKDLVAGFKAMLADIRAHPADYGPTGTSRRFRSHVLDYNDSSDPETLSDGDFDPVFDHTSDGSQF